MGISRTTALTAVTLTTTAAALWTAAQAESKNGFKGVILDPETDCVVTFAAATTAANGTRMVAGLPIFWPLDPGVRMWGITASGTAVIRISLVFGTEG